eukprot:s1637_g7.t1
MQNSALRAIDTKKCDCRQYRFKACDSISAPCHLCGSCHSGGAGNRAANPRVRQAESSALKSALGAPKAAGAFQRVTAPRDVLRPEVDEDHARLDRREEHQGREKLAAKWRAHESMLIAKLVDKFKGKCMKEAEAERCEASVSFATLVREIPEFPTHVITDSQHLVDNWGDSAASWWYYAHRGVSHQFVNGSPISFAELLESMMPRFLENLQDLGFKSCTRDPGTWKAEN